MPTAANPFDYRTIPHVLITLDYTALQSFTYRQQVIQQLNDAISAERAISIREQFADQWYDLHNPEQTSTPMVVRFNTVSQDCPPNIDDLRLQHALLYVVRAAGQAFEVSDTQLLLTTSGETTPVGGTSGSSIGGMISTRRSNAGEWTALIGRSPIGEWKLTLPNTQEVKSRFKNEEIEGVLLVVTYAGRTPAWPM